MDTKYLFPWQKGRYEAWENLDLPIKENLQVKIIENGYLLPSKKFNRFFGDGCVWDADRKVVPEGYTLNGRIRYSDPQNKSYEIATWNVRNGDGYDISSEKVQEIDNEVIYLGNLKNHWGHFLIDCANRLWYALQNPHMKAVFIVEHGKKNFSLLPAIRRFLELLKFNFDNLLFVSEVCHCKRIIIPESSYIRGGHSSTEFIKMFDEIIGTISPAKKISAEKIYFTRLDYGAAQRKEFGEEILANLFKKNGFKIIAPEQFSVDEQIYMINNCKMIAGVSGSAMHNLLFSKGYKECIICNKTFDINLPQFDINKMRNISCTYIDTCECLLPHKFGVGPFLTLYNENLQRFVADHNFIDVDDIYKSDDYTRNNIWNYIHKYKNYLYSHRNEKWVVKDNALTVNTEKTHCTYYPQEFSSSGMLRYWFVYQDIANKYKFLPDLDVSNDKLKQKILALEKNVTELKIQKCIKERPALCYQTHIGMYGWLPQKAEGETSGSLSESLGIQAIKIKFTSFYDVYYSVYSKEYGWSKEVSNYDTAGTTGKGILLSGIKIRLATVSQCKYDICYRIHETNDSWGKWLQNGQEAIIKNNNSFDAIEICVKRKW